MNSLQNVLNQSNLGPSFNDLGSKSGIYLSFQQGRGWSILRLDGCFGFIRRIFRALGFYSSTHLQVIQAQLANESNVPKALLDRVGICWARQTPTSAVIKTERLYQKDNISLWKGDITKMLVQAIVNAANEACLGGSGVDGAIHAAAGPALRAECEKLPCSKGIRCKTGEAVITGSGNLTSVGIQHVIHAVGPQGKDANLLKQTYQNSLELARKNGIKTIAFPSISTGIYGYDHKDATPVALQAVQEYLMKNPGAFDEVAFIFSEQVKCDFALALLK